MKKSIRYSIALCALLPVMAMGADTWWNTGVVGNWEDAANWNAGVPTASDRAIINNVADQVTVSATGAVSADMIMNGNLTVASAGELATGALNATTGTQAHTVVVGGQLIHGGSNWFQLGGSGGSSMSVSSGGSFTSSGSECIIGQGGAASLAVDGTFNRTGWLTLKDNGNITVNSDGLFHTDVLQTVGGMTVGLTINGGVSTIGTLGWGNGGTGTLDMNGGQLTITGFLDTPANTYNIGDGELFFTGTDVATVDARVSGANWNFAESKSVVDMGGGTIRVTSVLVYDPIIVASSVSNHVMRLVIDAPNGGESYYPVASGNLESAAWERIPHSDNGVNPFLVANLGYSTTDGSNTVIYVQASAAKEFFGLGDGVGSFMAVKTMFQTSTSYDPREALALDGFIVHRHGVGFSDLLSHIASWEARGGSVGRMFFADSDAGTAYTSGAWDGIDHSEDKEMNQNGDPIGSTRPYMVPTSGWTAYLQEQTEMSLLAGAAAIFPEEPLAHAYAGYSQSFRQLWESYYGFPWQAQHTSTMARFLTAQLQGKLYLDLEASLMETTHTYGDAVVSDPAFVIPIHSIYGNIAGQLVAPLGASTSLDELEGYIGQIWTGPINWSLGQYNSSEKSFFGSAYALYDYFTQLTVDTDKKLWLLVDPVEDDPNHTWTEYLEWYQHSVTAMLLMSTVDSYEVMPWPERIFLPGFETGGGSPAPEDFRKTVLAITQALQEMPLGGQWSLMDSTQPSTGISVAIADSSMWQEYHANRLQGTYGQLLPLIERGVPVGACVLERAANVSYMDRHKVIVVSYEDFKPVAEAMNTALAAWVQSGGVLVLLGNSNDDLDNDPAFWWQQLGYASPMHHLLSLVGGTGTGDWSFGSGYVIRNETSPAAFADPNVATSVYLPLIDLAIQHTASGGNLSTPGYFMMQRGSFVIAHARQQAVSKAGKYVDIFDPDLSVADGISLAVGESGLFRDVTQTLDGGGSPEVLHATHRLMSQQFDGDELRFVVKGPQDTPAVVRVFLGGETISGLIGKKFDNNEIVMITLTVEGDTARLEFQNDPDGVDVTIQM